MMQAVRGLTLRLAAISLTATTIAACTPPDYSDGITAFSQAVTKVDTAEQALAAADQQARLNGWLAGAQRGDPKLVSIDETKCGVGSGTYHAGDWTVVWSGQNAPITPKPSSMNSLEKYAALLSSVVADKTCASLQSDAKDLGTAVGDLAKDAKATALAAAAGPLATIVSTAGCLAIENMQLSILRQATSAANPIVQKLVPIISDRDTDMYDTAINDAHRQLYDANVSYNLTRSVSDLKLMVSLTQILEKLKLAPPGPAVEKMAGLHRDLTEDLAAPTVNLKRVQNDAQALIAAAVSVTSAAESLSNAGSPTAAKGAATKGAGTKGAAGS